MCAYSILVAGALIQLELRLVLPLFDGAPLVKPKVFTGVAGRKMDIAHQRCTYIVAVSFVGDPKRAHEKQMGLV